MDIFYSILGVLVVFLAIAVVYVWVSLKELTGKITAITEKVTAIAEAEPVATTEYILPIASPAILGGVKIGPGLGIAEDGQLSAIGLDVFVLNAVPTVDILESGQVAFVVE